MATNGVGCLIRCEVRRLKGTALGKWHPHGLSEAVEGRKFCFALGATFNHLQSRIDHGCPVEKRGQVEDPGIGLGWKGGFIRFWGSRERCRIWEANPPGFNLRRNRW